MPEAIGEGPVPVRLQRPEQGAAAGTAGPTLAGQDAVTLSARADETETMRWAAWAGKQVKLVPACEVQQIAAQVETRLAAPDPSPDAAASLHLAGASAFGRLTYLGIGRMSNGPKGFGHLAAAVGLRPGRLDVALDYGRTLLGFARESWPKRKIIELGLGIGIAESARKAIEMLARHPDEALAQAVRLELARWLDERPLKKQAEQAFEAVRRTWPEDTARALTELEADRRKADEARQQQDKSAAC